VLTFPGKGWALFTDTYKGARHDEYPERIVVLREARAMLNDTRALDLFKQLTEQRVLRAIRWSFSKPAAIVKGRIPEEWMTSARFVVEANSWPDDDADIAALRSRGRVLYFSPSARQMHAYAETWYKGDPDVFRFIGEHLIDCEEPDLRIYHEMSE